jgi:hypothetical protein
MATYFDPCTSLSGFTELGWNANTNWVIDGTSGFIRKSADVSLDALRIDAIESDGTRDNVEVVLRVRRETMNTTYRYIMLVRGSTTDEATITGYGLGYTTTAIRAVTRAGGTWTSTLATTSGLAAIASDEDWWLRFRANGTAIRVRRWKDGDSEPGTWDIDTTDSTYSTAGNVLGLTTTVTALMTFSAWGVGTNGDTAPTSAPATGSFAFSRAFPRPILNF